MILKTFTYFIILFFINSSLFANTQYFQEGLSLYNSKKFDEAKLKCANTLGLCWAGFAMAYMAGVEKNNFNKKLFGVYPMRSLVPGHSLMGTQDDEFLCPQSRHAGLPDIEMEKEEKKITFPRHFWENIMKKF